MLANACMRDPTKPEKGLNKGIAKQATQKQMPKATLCATQSRKGSKKNTEKGVECWGAKIAEGRRRSGEGSASEARRRNYWPRERGGRSDRKQTFLA